MGTTNKLYFGDCLDILKDLSLNNKEGFIDLIYIDPPFNSKRNYNILFEDAGLKDAKAQKEAFADTWSNVSYKDTIQEIQDIDLDLFNFLKALDSIRVSKSAVAYLTTMAIRIYYMHKVLKDTGSFYLHCDPNMSHYLKLVCDLVSVTKVWDPALKEKGRVDVNNYKVCQGKVASMGETGVESVPENVKRYIPEVAKACQKKGTAKFDFGEYVIACTALRDQSMCNVEVNILKEGKLIQSKIVNGCQQ